jgi:hypothetical protein
MSIKQELREWSISNRERHTNFPNKRPAFNEAMNNFALSRTVDVRAQQNREFAWKVLITLIDTLSL